MPSNNLVAMLAQRTNKDNFVQFNISPFDHQHLREIAALAPASGDVTIGAAISERYKDKHFRLTDSGRSALDLALTDLRLAPDDEVWIETTSNNFYISGCVTGTIEKHCKWARALSDKTRVILLNHEFGFPMEDIAAYGQYGLPIIEDCAHSFLSDNARGSVGAVADYVIASLPKFLPVPWGGALYSKRALATGPFEDADVLVSIVNHFLPALGQIAAKRRDNYRLLTAMFEQHGLAPRFELREHHTPGVFLFRTALGERANAFKAALNAQGVQSSVFYGEDAYYIPCHHGLDETDLAYIAHKTITTMKKYCDNR